MSWMKRQRRKWGAVERRLAEWVCCDFSDSYPHRGQWRRAVSELRA